MVPYYEKKFENIFNRFISFVKYLESWLPLIFLGTKVRRREKIKNN